MGQQATIWPWDGGPDDSPPNRSTDAISRTGRPLRPWLLPHPPDMLLCGRWSPPAAVPPPASSSPCTVSGPVCRFRPYGSHPFLFLTDHPPPLFSPSTSLPPSLGFEISAILFLCLSSPVVGCPGPPHPAHRWKWKSPRGTRSGSIGNPSPNRNRTTRTVEPDTPWDRPRQPSSEVHLLSKGCIWEGGSSPRPFFAEEGEGCNCFPMGCDAAGNGRDGRIRDDCRFVAHA